MTGLRVLPATLVLFFWALPALAGADVYFAQTSAGAENGADCADAYAYDDATHGIDGKGSASWAAGSTLHLCPGTWSGVAGQQWVSTNGNGTSASPITVRFETGATLTAPYHANQGAVRINNTFIIIDGGTNGAIENTLNGSVGAACPGGRCTQQQSSRLVYNANTSCDPCGIEIKNLKLGPVYVHTRDAGDPGSLISEVEGIYSSAGNGTGITIDHNTIHDAAQAIDICGSNVVIAFNEIYSEAWGIGGGVQGITSVDSFVIHDNVFHNSNAWVDGSSFHINTGFHIYPSTGAQLITHFQAYNNSFYDPADGANTAFMYMEGQFTSAAVFNNACILASAQADFCLEAGTDSGQATASTGIVANNTCVGGEYGPTSYSCYNIGGQSGSAGWSDLTYVNNVHVMGGQATAPLQAGLVDFNGVAIAKINNDLFENMAAVGAGDGFAYNGASASTLAAWQALLPSGSGQESAGVYDSLTNLKVSLTTGQLQSGSPAVGGGMNLTGQGIAALDCDKPRVVGPAGTGACNHRPASGPWDIGAYQYCAGSGCVAADGGADDGGPLDGGVIADAGPGVADGGPGPSEGGEPSDAGEADASHLVAQDSGGGDDGVAPTTSAGGCACHAGSARLGEGTYAACPAMWVLASARGRARRARGPHVATRERRPHPPKRAFPR